jgi:hypothetical protein
MISGFDFEMEVSCYQFDTKLHEYKYEQISVFNTFIKMDNCIDDFKHRVLAI